VPLRRFGRAKPRFEAGGRARGILVASFGISMRNSSDEELTQTARVMKAGKPVMVTTSNKSVKS